MKGSNIVTSEQHLKCSPLSTTEMKESFKRNTTFDWLLRHQGYTKLQLQIGHGKFEPEVVGISTESPAVDYYRFKDSISDDIHNSDLVISHAGAGSVLEVLADCKPLLVVINDQLMDNHQIDLAKRLSQDGHLHYCTCSTLMDTLAEVDFTHQLPFMAGNPSKFSEHLDSLMGFI